MKTYMIDSENNITAYESADVAATGEGLETFTTEKKLASLAADWPAARLVEIWNSLPGVVPVRRFQGRASGVARIWKAIQSLGTISAQPAGTKDTPDAPPLPAAREGSKKAQAAEDSG